MTIPFREWFQFQHMGFYYQATGGWVDTRPNWLRGKTNHCRTGWARSNAVPNIFTEWRGIARPIYNFEVDDVNLNLIFDYYAEVYQILSTNTAAGVTHCHPKNEGSYYPTSPNTWDSILADGWYYDGVNYWCGIGNTPFMNVNDYTAFFPSTQWNTPYPSTVFKGYGCRYKAGWGPDVWMNKWQYEKNGLALYNVNPAGAPAAGEEITFFHTLQYLKYYYLNPVVNSIAPVSVLPGGGTALVLTGLCFDVPDAELEDTTYNLFNSHPPGGWNQQVYHIEFQGLQGQGNFLLHGHIPNSDFTIDSNTQITIPAGKMPALTDGTYQIYLYKDKAGFGGGYPLCGPANAYAGDWRSAANGRLTQGTRITLLVGTPDPGRKKPVIYSKWKWKGWGGSIFKYYSPIDIIAPTIFYDGRILQASTLIRQVSERTGLYTCSDMDFTMANADYEFSRLLAQYWLKNQVVEIYYGWAEQAEAFKVTAAVLMVDDYTHEGPNFQVKCRDITTKYFKQKVPRYRCTAAEYPNIHKNHENRPMPEVLGNAYLTSTGQGGAVEAVLVDTLARKYLAARGSLHAVTAVYKDGLALNPLLWSSSYEDGGRTYLTLDISVYDASSKITFDAQGYSFAMWDSANGYVQNPSYIIAFYLALLLEVPIDFIDLDAFDDMAGKFVDEGEDTSCFLILQREQDGDNYLQQLLFTWGLLSVFDNYGRFHIEKKDVNIIGTDLFIFSQIDTMGFPEFNHRMTEAINRIRYRWHYSPGQETYYGGNTADRATSQIDFEQVLEAPDFIDFHWTTSATWAAKRAEEELQKYGYGLPEIRFDLGWQWIDQLDVLTNFRLQDPFGISATGAGELGRFCYVSSLAVDFQGMKLSVIAQDLNWILYQYLMLGDETVLPANWTGATFEEKIWAYLCDEITGRFANGEPGKKLVNEIIT